MIGAHQPQATRRGWIITSLRWIAAVVVLAILLHFVPLHTLREAIARIPPARFIIVLFIYMCAHLVGVAKWKMVVNAAGAQLDFRTCVQCYGGGLFGTLFLPSIIGGDVVRLAVGLRKSPRPAAVLAGNVADRFLDMLSQGALVVIGLLLLPGAVPAEFQMLARHMLLIAAAVVIAVVAFVAIFSKRLLAGRSIRFRRRIARLRHAIQSVADQRGKLALGWLMGAAIQFCFIILNALLAISCGLLIPLRIWLFAWPLAKLSALLPLTQGGMGIREAVLVGLMRPFGASGTLVLAAGLVWEGIVIAGGLISGAVAYLLRDDSKSEQSASGAHTSS